MRGGNIAPTIAPFCKRCDGRGALKAIVDQHAGVRVWDDMAKCAKDVMGGSCKWTGTTVFTVAQHCNVHCKAFIALGKAADHVHVQIPDERTKVTNLMDSFETVDPTVLAALSSVHQDEGCKMINFEACVTFLIQSCPVVAKQKKKSVAFGASVSAIETHGPTSNKPLVGASGEPLLYHEKEEFAKLTPVQRKEVSAWVNANPSPGESKRAQREPRNGNPSSLW